MQDAPRFGPYTIVAALLCAAIAIYLLTTRDPAGYVIAAVLLVFVVLPALLLYVFNARERRDRHE